MVPFSLERRDEGMKGRSSPYKDGSALDARVLDALLAKLNSKGRGKGKDKGDKGVLKTIGKHQVSPEASACASRSTRQTGVIVRIVPFCMCVSVVLGNTLMWPAQP